MRCFQCYDKWDWTALLPHVEFAYNETCALGIELTPFKAVFGFSHEEPTCLMFNMRLSIPVSQDAMERFRQLKKLHTSVSRTLGVTTTQG
jgi:hypothetical protein